MSVVYKSDWKYNSRFRRRLAGAGWRSRSEREEGGEGMSEVEGADEGHDNFDEFPQRRRLGGRLREAREHRGLLQAEAAIRVGLQRSAL